jgi:hypothetical protein
MNSRIRVEITGRDEFWRGAVLVEWEDQYPERKLVAEPGGAFLIDADWLADLSRVASECFSEVVVAAKNGSRRMWLRRLIRPLEHR